MQKTSALYKKLFNDPNHWTEISLVIGESGKLITEYGNAITFGGVAILVATSGPESGFDSKKLISLQTSHRLFPGDELTVGKCVAGEINIVMEKPLGDIPNQARLAPFIRLTNGKETSEWIPKGVFFIDQRPTSGSKSAIETIHITGYDAMLKTEQPYPSSALKWPAKDVDVVREIAQSININVDAETLRALNKGYLINLPTGYTERETLSYIAAMYAGWFIINNEGELRLVTLGSIPKETRQLIDNDGNKITFGGVRINV